VDRLQKGKKLFFVFHDVSADQGAISSWYGVKTFLNITNLTWSVSDPLYP
jgi:hypothetical protein